MHHMSDIEELFASSGDVWMHCFPFLDPKTSGRMRRVSIYFYKFVAEKSLRHAIVYYCQAPSEIWDNAIVKARVYAGKSFCDDDNGGLIGLKLGGYTFADDRPIALYAGLFMTRGITFKSLFSGEHKGPVARCGDGANVVAIVDVFNKEVTCAVDIGHPEILIRSGVNPSVWDRLSPMSIVFCKIAGVGGYTAAYRRNLPACNIDAEGTMFGQRLYIGKIDDDTDLVLWAIIATLSDGSCTKFFFWDSDSTNPSAASIMLPAGETSYTLQAHWWGKHAIARYVREMFIYSAVSDHECACNVVEAGMRVAQLILEQHLQAPVVEMEDELPTTCRGEGGFGSTGLNTETSTPKQLSRASSNFNLSRTD